MPVSCLLNDASNRTVVGIGVFYYTLGNIRPSRRSTLKAIQLVVIAKTKIIEYYGIDTILQPFMDSVKELETVCCLFTRVSSCYFVLVKNTRLGNCI